MSVEKTMLAVTSVWDGKPSFRLMPLTVACPYSEGIYDPTSKILVMMSSFRKETLNMVPSRDENGDPVKTKGPRPNGKTYKEKQILIDTFTEFYVQEKKEILEFVKMITVNDTFDIEQFMKEPSSIIVPETPKLELIK